MANDLTGATREGAPAQTRRTRATRWLAAGCASLALAACGTADSPPPDQPVEGASGPPTLLNEELPVHYPGTLWARGVEGEVTLRLYVDSTGAVVADSTRLENSSGQPQLDSAALRGVPEMRFSPAMTRGRPVAASLLVPVVFSRDTATTDTSTVVAPPPPTASPAGQPD